MEALIRVNLKSLKACLKLNKPLWRGYSDEPLPCTPPISELAEDKSLSLRSRWLPRDPQSLQYVACPLTTTCGHEPGMPTKNIGAMTQEELQAWPYSMPPLSVACLTSGMHAVLEKLAQLMPLQPVIRVCFRQPPVVKSRNSCVGECHELRAHPQNTNNRTCVATCRVWKTGQRSQRCGRQNERAEGKEGRVKEQLVRCGRQDEETIDVPENSSYNSGTGKQSTPIRNQ
eukprot:scaffold88009_cov17-Tisochrysis_lutea.AAC.1